MQKMKSIPGYEGLYSATEDGGIYSHKRKLFMVQQKMWNGYMSVLLSKNGKQKMFRVHRVVASAFLGESNLTDVNHINSIRHDNRVINLEYCSRKQNMAHARLMGRLKIENRKRKLLKLSTKTIKDILKEQGTLKEVAKKYGVDYTTISNIRRGKYDYWLNKETPKCHKCGEKIKFPSYWEAEKNDPP